MLDLSRFSVLSFDCYGTMIDWEAGIFSALRPILGAHNKRVNDVTLLKIYSELELEAEQKEYVSYHEVLQAVVRGFGERLGFDPSEEEVCSLPKSLAAWQPFPDTVGALRELKTRYQLAVISNIEPAPWTPPLSVVPHILPLLSITRPPNMIVLAGKA